MCVCVCVCARAHARICVLYLVVLSALAHVCAQTCKYGVCVSVSLDIHMYSITFGQVFNDRVD